MAIHLPSVRAALRRPSLFALLVLLAVSSASAPALAQELPSSAASGHPVFLGYNVSFRESGLPFGSTWSISVNSVTISGATRTLTVPEVGNGSWTYNVGTVTGYSAFPSTGTITVAGANPATTAIAFAQTPGHYTVAFTETGLPAGVTSWNVTFNGTVYPSNGFAGGGPSISIPAVVNGTYAFSVASQYGLFPAPSTGTITVNGANTAPQNINFGLAPGHYTVNFAETGLPFFATSWNVTFNGTFYAANGFGFGGPTISIANVVNGTYTFSVAPQYGLYPSPISGQIVVNGADPATQTIAFGPFPGHYSVAFSETGLVRGMNWYLTFNGSVYVTPVAAFGPTVLTIPNVVNGTYAWNTTVPGFTAAPPSGSLTVNGASPATTNIAFTAIPGQYTVTFREGGLPVGTASWSVTFNGTTQTGAVPFPPIVYSGIVNGNYTFSVPNDAGCVPSPSSGTISVAGASLTQRITFTCPPPGSFPVWFNETGLAPGLTWSVTFNAGTSSTLTSSIQFFAPNGAYTFTVGAPGRWAATPASGTVTVSGASVSTSIVFVTTANRFNTTFTESGLPTGTTWSVTYNGTLLSSPTTTILYAGMLNGTYSFSVGAVGPRVPTPASGSITVNGADQAQAIVFNMTYNATFTQSGLPGSTSWSVSVGIQVVSGNTGALVFTGLVNQTSAFTVGSVPGYTAAPASGSLSIAGSSVTEAIAFKAIVHLQYTVSFSESGLANGTSWSITFNGSTASATSGSAITFQVYNATGLSYSVGTVSGYSASPTSGSVNVQGAAVNVPVIQFTKSTGGSSGTGLGGGLGGYGLYALIAVVVVVAALLGLFLLLRRRKGGSSPKGPSTSTEEGTAAAAAGTTTGSTWAESAPESSDGTAPSASSPPPSSDGPEADAQGPSPSEPPASTAPDSDGQPPLPAGGSSSE